MHCGGGGAVRRTPSEPSLTQSLRLTSFRVLVTALGCTKPLLRVEVLVIPCGDQWPPSRPRPRTASVSSGRAAQSRGWWPQTLLVRARRGGGAATGHGVTEPQAEEQQRGATQPHGLRALGPAVLHTVGAVALRKEPQVSSPRCRPVRRQAPALPSGDRLKSWRRASGPVRSEQPAVEEQSRCSKRITTWSRQTWIR